MTQEAAGAETLPQSLNVYLLMCDDDEGENYDLIVEADDVDMAMHLWYDWMKDDFEYEDEYLPSVRRIWQLARVRGSGVAHALKWGTEDMIQVYKAEVRGRFC